MIKATIRQQFLAQRRALSIDEVSVRSQLLTQHFFEFLKASRLASESGVIHAFLPIIRQNEVDTWPIIWGIWENFSHLQVAVPVTNASTHTLSHYLLSPATLLVENRWGIPEPIPTDTQPLSSDEFSLILVPLLIFDQQGHRVGYGGGFYDRFLAECRPDCLKIGVSLFEPIECIDDVEPTDIRLDACITPWKTYRFSTH
ncbi:5-formyltetrahydrofolate cyclo-ligase [Spirosoma endophyticum]|uniref:5-formyltetrahydrofolate cyclo-ligase n=1 Tax=Spirosoma endophyticum TaxID=662367 RepID=A0A1I1PJS1_9BACT|nr:5-formyltetrahydrofolate cyclo-ligase [Spirosoma endophyticum]SFD07948.1 5-formyltetrahydrofolate cyclo-ligase [Spirosoma endophyticum]